MAPELHLYTSGTPNGQKASITLSLLSIAYTTHSIAIAKNVQKEAWFLDICPNGRIPALIDSSASPSTVISTDPIVPKGKRIFESGALMLYLCARYDKEEKISFRYDTDEYYEMVEWLFWQHGGIGPIQGQANHFYRYAPEKIQYGIDRYQTETKRLYSVLEDRLASEKKKSSSGDGPWIVGDKLTIADIANFAWINWAEWAGVSTEPFPEVRAWLDRINAMEPVQQGLNVPEKFEMKEKMRTKEGEEEYASMHSNWVMQGQKADQEKHR